MKKGAINYLLNTISKYEKILEQGAIMHLPTTVELIVSSILFFHLP